MDCPNCGDRSNDEYANYCSTCGNRLKATKNRSNAQSAAGVLIILSSCMTGAFGLLFLMPFTLSIGIRTSAFSGIASIVSLFELAAFIVGLMSGILILKRQYFSLSLIGISLVTVSGFFHTFIPVIGMFFGVPVLSLAFLALILSAASRKEFV